MEKKMHVRETILNKARSLFPFNPKMEKFFKSKHENLVKKLNKLKKYL